jgi:hypothetical protein
MHVRDYARLNLAQEFGSKNWARFR